MYPIMPLYGKRKSHAKNGYKADDEPTKNKEKMPVPAIEHELVDGVSDFESGDDLYSTKKVFSIEEIPSGSFGSFARKGRKGIIQQVLDDLAALKMKSEADHEELAALRMKAERMESDLTVTKEKLAKTNAVNQSLMFENLLNHLTQLFYGVEHADILTIVKDTYITNGERALHYDGMLKIVDDETWCRIVTSPVYKTLMPLLIDNDSDFRHIIRMRNRNVHPRTIDLSLINSLIELIGLGEHLSVEEKKAFELIKRLYKVITEIPQLKQLVEIYNKSKK